MEQKIENTVTTTAWSTPKIEIINLSLECTAYAGAEDFEVEV